MSKLAHSNQETMDEIERRSEIEGDYIASIEGPHEDKPPAHPSLEELDKCIAINEAFKARKNADVIINPDRATDIELYCLHAVRDGVGAKRQTELEDANNACIELAAKHGYATGHGDTVGDIMREFNAQIPDRAQSPWMDIETAPKDGTWVLTLSWPWSKIPTSLYWDRYHWSDACEAYPSKKIAEWQPTHWMPLPAPPTHNSLSNDKKPDTTANLYPSWNHNGFTRYRRTQITELRPFTPGEELDPNVSISQIDCEGGSPKLGDMIARNPKNHGDQWLISAAYFREHFKRIDLSHNHGEGDPS